MTNNIVGSLHLNSSWSLMFKTCHSSDNHYPSSAALLDICFCRIDIGQMNMPHLIETKKLYLLIKEFWYVCNNSYSAFSCKTFRFSLLQFGTNSDNMDGWWWHVVVCPHMGCIVKWNPIDHTFDCPCHGSKFDHYGRCINAPAKADLSPQK